MEDAPKRCDWLNVSSLNLRTNQRTQLEIWRWVKEDLGTESPVSKSAGDLVIPPPPRIVINYHILYKFLIGGLLICKVISYDQHKCVSGAAK